MERFTVDDWSEGRIAIQDQDFGYDAALELTGDFGGIDGSKKRYAQAVCDVLNAAAATIPVDNP